MVTIIMILVGILVLLAVARAAGGLLIIGAVIWLGVTGADKVHLALTGDHLPGYKDEVRDE